MSAPVEDTRAVFQRALGGAAFSRLSPALRRFHGPGAGGAWAGCARVEHGRNRLARWLSRRFGFPAAAAAVPVRVTVIRAAGSERWTRQFGTRGFRSVLCSRRAGVVTERLGGFSFDLYPRPDALGGLDLPLDGWRLGVLPLPMCLAPRARAREFEDGPGRFRFDIRLALPLLGLLVHYRGYLVPTGE